MQTSKTRHGSPYDRGAADSYYRRGRKPHYYVGATAQSRRIEKEDMTEQEIVEYNEGYDTNEKECNHKDWR